MEQRALRTPSPLLLRRERAVVGRGHGCGQRTRERRWRRGCPVSSVIRMYGYCLRRVMYSADLKLFVYARVCVCVCLCGGVRPAPGRSHCRPIWIRVCSRRVFSGGGPVNTWRGCPGVGWGRVNTWRNWGSISFSQAYIRVKRGVIFVSISIGAKDIFLSIVFFYIVPFPIAFSCGNFFDVFFCGEV